MRLKLFILLAAALLPVSPAFACSCVPPPVDADAPEQRERIAMAAIGAAAIGEFVVVAEPRGANGAGGRLRPLRLLLGSTPASVRVAAPGRLWSSATCDTDLPRGRRIWLILYRPDRRWPADQALARRLLDAERTGNRAALARVRSEVTAFPRARPRSYRPLGLCEQYLTAPAFRERILAQARRLNRTVRPAR